MFKSIVVATDGSVHAEHAVKVGCELAGKFQAKLTFVHVLGNGPVPSGFEHWAQMEHLANRSTNESPMVENIAGNLSVAESGGDSKAYQFRLREIAGEQIIKQARQKAKQAGITGVKDYIVSGNPADCIVARAQTEDADLIVMGTRGLSTTKGLLMGSVSSKVCKIADSVCMTVK